MIHQGIAGGARRRPTKAPAPDVDARFYQAHWSGRAPEDGAISADAVRPSLVTHLYVSNKGEEFEDNSNWLAEVCANMYDLVVELDDDPCSYAMYRVTAVTVNTNYYDFTVTYLSSAGDLPDGCALRFDILPVPNAILTAKGDLLTRSSTTPVRLPVGADSSILVADASTSTGLHWLFPAAFWFGDGRNSSSTLGANTTLGTNLGMCRNYTTLDVVTFTLTSPNGANAERNLFIFCSVLFTGNGGQIKGETSSVSGGSARTSGAASSGAGGTTGGFQGGVFVFVRKISGTVTVSNVGLDGGNGGNASGTPAGAPQVGGAGGPQSLSINVFMTGASVNCGAFATNPAGGGTGNDTGGTGSVAPTHAEHTAGYFDVLRWFFCHPGQEFGIATGSRWSRFFTSPGAGGGGGGGLSSTNNSSGGGGGGGCYSWGERNGSDGGQGGAGGGTSGGGGGGGGAGTCGGTVALMVGEFAAAASLTVNVNGGNGGNGGNATANGGGGGGGAGGLGGFAFCVFPKNYTAVTTSITATKGTKGTKGTGAGTGTNGADGNDGSDGHTYIMTWG